MTNVEREVAVSTALGIIDLIEANRCEFGKPPVTVHILGIQAERVAKALIAAESAEVVRVVCEATGRDVPNVDEW